MPSKKLVFSFVLMPFLALAFFRTALAVTWQDGTIQAGATAIKANHINQIRDVIDDIIDGSQPISGGGKWTDGAGGDIYYNAGDVGIGVSNPSVKLDISGAIRATSHVQSGSGSGGVALTVNDGKGNANVTFNHMAGTPGQNGTAGRIEVNTDSTGGLGTMDFELGGSVTGGVNTNLSGIMRLQSDGKVGIGTISPAAQLHVNGGNVEINGSGTIGGANMASAWLLLDGGTYSVGLDPNEIYAEGIDLNIGTLSAHGINFNTNGSSNRVKIASNGNVGIGTTNPSQKLHVLGNTYLEGNLYLGNTDTSLFRDLANRIATDDSFYVRSASPATYLYSTNTYLGNTSGDTTHLRGNNLTWNQGIIQGNGNMGIGTTTPAEKLEVANGIIRSGSSSATSGQTIIEGDYSGANVINTLGSQYSSGATVLGYGVRPKSGSSGYVSSAGNAAFSKGVLELHGGSLTYKTAPAATVAIGTDVAMTDRFTVNSAGTVTATAYVGNGAGLTALNASNLTTGTLDLARIANNSIPAGKLAANSVGLSELSATGTKNTTTFLRGDNTWATVAGDNLGNHSASQPLYLNNQPLVSAGGTNFDFIRHNDGTNTWNFGSDQPDTNNTTYGGGTIQAGSARFNGRSVFLGTGDQRIYGDNGSAMFMDSNHSTVTQMLFRDKEDTIYGRVYGDSNGSNFGLMDGDANWAILSQKDNNIQFRVNNSEKMRILSNGNVGIGTSSPSQKLQVNGTVRANRYEASPNSALPMLTLDSSSSGDNWTSQGAQISIGESGAGGSASMHMTYRGDGYGFIGSGAVSNGEPGASYLRFDYDSNNIYTPDTITAGAFVGNGSGLTGIVPTGAILDYTPGNWEVASNTNSSNYSNAALEVRELNNAGSQTGALSESPRISFHWGGRVASQIGMDTSGAIRTFNNPGTGYERFVASGLGVNTLGTGNMASGAAIAIGDSDTGIKQMGDGQLAFFTNNAEEMRITNAGRVGIGTTNPMATLQVEVGGDLSLTSTGHAATFGQQAGLNIGIDGNEIMARNNGAESPIYMQNNGGDFFVHHAQGGGTEFVVKDNGNVGVGTTSPAERLHVNGGKIRIAFSDPTLELQELDGTANENFQLRVVNGDLRFERNNDAFSSPIGPFFVIEKNGSVGINNVNPAGAFEIGTDNSAPANPVTQLNAGGTGSNEGAELRIGIANDFDSTYNYYYIDAWQDDFRIGRAGVGDDFYLKSNGNIGIGTTNPSYKLHVNGDTRVNGWLRTDGNTGWYNQTYGGGWNMQDTTWIRAYGNKNILTAGDFRGARFMDNDNTAYYADPTGRSQFFGLDIDSEIRHRGDGNTLIYFPANDTIRLRTAGADRLQVSSNGNVGIGTTSPQSVLHVDGAMQFGPHTGEQLMFGGNSGRNFFAPRNSANNNWDWTKEFGFSITDQAWYFDGDVEAGKGSGAVALTANDGGGNANVTFNHTSRVPDVTGNAGRIVVNVDSTTNANMSFQLANGLTAGTAASTTEVFRIDADGKVRAANYCDMSGNNCHTTPGGTLIAVNGAEDIYGAWTANGGGYTWSQPTTNDNCPGAINLTAYSCSVSETTNCTDVITTYNPCGKDNNNSCPTYQKRTIDCKRLEVYGQLTP